MTLIDRDALTLRIDQGSIFAPYDMGEMIKTAVIKLLGIAPTIDAVPVVRCKDCKHSGMYCFGASYEPTFACLDIEEDGFVRMATAADPEGYCSKGERRSE